MLKITATGNLTNDVELKMNETTGKPYAILRIASDRRYRDQEGNRLTDFISIKVRGPPGRVLCCLCLEGLQAGGGRIRVRYHSVRRRTQGPQDFGRERPGLWEICVCGRAGNN